MADGKLYYSLNDLWTQSGLANSTLLSRSALGDMATNPLLGNIHPESAKALQGAVKQAQDARLTFQDALLDVANAANRLDCDLIFEETGRGSNEFNVYISPRFQPLDRNASREAIAKRLSELPQF